MKRVISYILKLVFKTFTTFFIEPVKSDFKKKDAISKRLGCILQIDAIEKAFYEFQSKKIPTITDELIITLQKQQAQKKPPQIVDFKEQFKTWSQNMKDYDRLRSRLINTAQG